MGNWSRFVRPGAFRVTATAQPQTYAFVTAFIDPATNQVAIVAINAAQYRLDQSFTIAGGGITEVTPWLTSADVALTAQAPLPVTNGTFSAMLPARSVTTFVGTASF
jgi:glucuronoarabinoxylan endo-1,4-beta-xylanase